MRAMFILAIMTAALFVGCGTENGVIPTKDPCVVWLAGPDLWDALVEYEPVWVCDEDPPEDFPPSDPEDPCDHPGKGDDNKSDNGKQQNKCKGEKNE